MCCIYIVSKADQERLLMLMLVVTKMQRSLESGYVKGMQGISLLPTPPALLPSSGDRLPPVASHLLSLPSKVRLCTPASRNVKACAATTATLGSWVACDLERATYQLGREVDRASFQQL